MYLADINQELTFRVWKSDFHVAEDFCQIELPPKLVQTNTSISLEF